MQVVKFNTLQIDLTVIFTLSALIISLITLWFSHLKGPDIEICDVSEIELEDWSNDELENYVANNYIPSSMSLRPIQLVFVNNGSRAGAITDINVGFEPCEKFRPFYRDNYVRINVDKKEPGMDRDALPVSIENGGTCVSKLQSTLQITDWQRDFRHEGIRDLPNLRKAIEESVELDKIHFEQFVDFLKSKESLGILTINMTYLGRKWFRTRKRLKELAKSDVRNNSKTLLEGITRLLENWESSSAVSKLLRSVPNLLDELIQRLNENSEKVQIDLEVGKNLIGLNDLSDWQRRYVQSRTIERIVIEREKLKSEIDELTRQMREYNLKISITSIAREDINADKINSLNRERKELQSRIKATLSKLRETRRKVISEIETSV